MEKQRIFTLAIVRDGNKVLLGKKKRKLGKGFWNGFGGGVEEDETVTQAAARECREEAGITVTRMTKRGVIDFYYASKPLGADIHKVHVFEVEEFSGDPHETDEMIPRWFSISDIPYDNMWEDDQYWLPLLLAGKQFVGKCTFDEREKLVDYTFNEITYA